MSSHPHRRYTLDEYFELELSSEVKYEYWSGDVYAMSGGSPAHELIISNLIIGLGNRLRGRGCRIFPSNLRVKVPSLLPYRYPDLTVLCDTPQYEMIGGLDALTNPLLIVEVLSPTTEA